MPKRKAEVEAKRSDEEPEEEDDEQEEQPGSSEDESEDEGESGNSEGEEGESEGDSEDSFPEASSSGEESEDDDEGEAYKQVECAFEFFDPTERDFHGLKALLNTYVDGNVYDSSGLVEAVIRQTAVGTVVKSSEDDDPFALMTVFNTSAGAAAKEAWLKQVLEYIAARCPDADTKAKLLKAFAGPGTGLLVSERLINCPPQLAPPLMQMLMEEIEGAATDEDYPKEERDEFTFKRYLHFTRVYTDPGPAEEDVEDAGAGPSTSAPPGSRRNSGKSDKPLIVYVRPEDEYLHQVCSWSFTFPIEGRPVAKGDLVPLRAVMCIEAGRVAEAREMMDLVVGNMMADGGGAGQPAGAAAGAKKGETAAGSAPAARAVGKGAAPSTSGPKGKEGVAKKQR
ncbi:hypothetical protein GPECTOR_64g151 [Gonium pectorale]|uniref:Protein BCCIP homolog n=1 Tax=Gonium pectorale TaxID=33097 RepID=A0A150G475_GONPE|nr:hypothetical protein GPECTOR_64g151 [Gonium pectorale]|eukprot:KXZ44657.1 hypothetical protein GPECTOR_64g151 [Gonium pectorale]